MRGAFSELFSNAPGFAKPERVQEKNTTPVCAANPIKKTNQAGRANPLKNLKISDELIKEARAKALGFEPLLRTRKETQILVKNPELNLDDGIFRDRDNNNPNAKFNKLLGYWKEQSVTALRHQSSQSVSGHPNDYNDPLYSSVEEIQEEGSLLPNETPQTAGAQLHPGIVELGQTMAHAAVDQFREENQKPVDNLIDALPAGNPSLSVTPSLQLLAAENPAPVAENQNPVPVAEESSPAASMTFSEKKAFQDLCSKDCFKEMLENAQRSKTGEPGTSSSAAAAAVLKSATPIINASRRASQTSPSEPNLVGDGEGVLQDEPSSGSDNTLTGQEMADHVLSYAFSFRQRVLNLPELRPPTPTQSFDDLYRFYNHEKTKLQGIQQDGLFLLDFSRNSRNLFQAKVEKIRETAAKLPPERALQQLTSPGYQEYIGVISGLKSHEALVQEDIQRTRTLLEECMALEVQADKERLAELIRKAQQEQEAENLPQDQDQDQDEVQTQDQDEVQTLQEGLDQSQKQAAEAPNLLEEVLYETAEQTQAQALPDTSQLGRTTTQDTDVSVASKASSYSTKISFQNDLPLPVNTHVGSSIKPAMLYFPKRDENENKLDSSGGGGDGSNGGNSGYGGDGGSGENWDDSFSGDYFGSNLLNAISFSWLFNGLKVDLDELAKKEKPPNVPLQNPPTPPTIQASTQNQNKEKQESSGGFFNVIFRFLIGLLPAFFPVFSTFLFRWWNRRTGGSTTPFGFGPVQEEIIRRARGWERPQVYSDLERFAFNFYGFLDKALPLLRHPLTLAILVLSGTVLSYSIVNDPASPVNQSWFIKTLLDGFDAIGFPVSPEKYTFLKKSIFVLMTNNALICLLYVLGCNFYSSPRKKS